MSIFSRAIRRFGSNVVRRLVERSGVNREDRRLAPARGPLVEFLENRQLLTAVYPEIDIRGNGQSIADADATPSVADYTSFGSCNVSGETISRTFYVANTGDGVLNLTGATRVKISGAAAADFSVTTLPSATVAAKTGTSKFVLKFDPSASGARNATVTIYNDDDDENPYTFSISGTGTVSPKVSVTGNSVAITPGSTAYSTSNSTSFGTCESDAGTISKTFTVTNRGSGTLTFDAGGAIVKSGAGAGYFIVSGPAGGDTLAAGASVNFTVVFTPATDTGTLSATIDVATNDPTYPDYKFNVQGKSMNMPSIEIEGNTTTISPNDLTPSAGDHTDFGNADVVSGLITRTFTINNNGSAALTLTGTVRVTVSGANPGDFIVTDQPAASVAAGGSDTFEVKFDPKASGLRTAIISVSSNDTVAGQSPYKFKVQGTGTTAPKISVTGNTNAIADGSTSFVVSNQTDIGSALVDFGSITKTYTIRNSGSSSLTLGANAVSIAGGNAANFTIDDQPDSILAAGASTTFTISFVPSASGNRSTTVSINNDDPTGDGVFDFNLQGVGVAVPRMVVKGNANAISSGDTTPSTADFTNFGSTTLVGVVNKTFNVYNTGSDDLTLDSSDPYVVISGPAAGDFTVLSDITSDTIAAGASDSFIISFTPTATGPRFATVTIINNDPLEGNSPYTFVIEGTGTSTVDMSIDGNGNTITDGDLTPSVADDTNFGSVNIGGTVVSHTFLVINSGTDALNLTGTPIVLLGGTFASDYTVTEDAESSVGAAATTAFTLTFDPKGTGARDATVTICSDDADHPYYTFNITGTGVAVPNISVTGKDGTLLTTGNTPATADGTDFGTTIQTVNSVTNTFTIRNSGTGTLTITSISSDNVDFTILNVPTTIEPGLTATFDVYYLPTAAATDTATITIASDDPDTASYDFDVTGVGDDAGLAALYGNGQLIVTGDTVPSAFDGTYFGKVEKNNGEVTRTFTLKNIGTSLLTLSANVLLTTGSVFTITDAPQSADTIAAGASVTFTVTYNPTAAGTDTDTLTVASDDPNSPYVITLSGEGINAPAMVVKGNAIDIQCGDDTARDADDTDFGTADLLTGAVSHTFTIKNIGSATMKLTGTPKVTVAGNNPTDFIVTTQPAASTLAAAATTTFVVRFNPTALGSRDAVISIASDDPANPAYTFTVSGEGTSTPIMTVYGNSTLITSGDTTPNSSDHTNFGGKDVNTGTVVRTFTIYNTGSLALNLTGDNVISISGDGAADYTVTTEPTSTTLAAATGSVTFQITFDPTASGVRDAVISIPSDDPNAEDYTFAITGTGLVTPAMTVKGLSSTTISYNDVTPATTDGTDFGTIEADNGSQARQFTIYNTGSGVLRLTAANRVSVAVDSGGGTFTVVTQPDARIAATSGSSTFEILYEPDGSTDVTLATVTIVSDDPTHGSFTFGIKGTGQALPVMGITGNSNAISKGSTTISTDTDTSFGSLDITGQNVSKTFTINNTGSGNLTFSGTPKVVISGAAAADFTVTAQPASPVAAAGSTTFIVKFDPSVVGVRNATVSIANNDTARSPYTFAIQGIGYSAPAMAVKGGAGPTTIVDGDTTPDTNDGTDFGTAAITFGSVSNTFVIKNTGSSALSLTSTPTVNISGANSSDFTLTTAPAATVGATTGSVSFVIKFVPSAAGLRTATVSIPSNDPAVGSYDFTISGTGVTAPNIVVTGNSTSIAKGSTTLATTNYTDFGKVSTNGGTYARTYTIANSGTTDLNITSVGVAGNNAGDFVVTTAPDSVIAAGSSSTFVVTFTAGATGSRYTTLSIVSDDTANTPYSFKIGGTGVAASSMAVYGGAGAAALISNADSTPDVADYTDFGSALVNANVSKTFVVKNTGAAALVLSGSPLVVIGGKNAADFSVTTLPSSSVAATTGTSNVVVKFTPKAEGLRTATLTFRSNDPSNPIYTYTIQGSGTVAPSMLVKGGDTPTTITSGDASPSTTDYTDFGNAELNLGTVTKTFTISNGGTDALNFTGSPIVVLTGDTSDFEVITVPRRSVAAGGTTTFQVIFHPTVAGARTASVSIASDDAATPYTFDIKGTAILKPAIQLSGNNVVIAKGDTSPAAADHTSFGTTTVTGGTVARTFTITNLGSATLNLTGTPKVALSGTNAADFSVSVVPGSNTIAADGAITTFEITFNPSAVGLRTCVVTIASDDPNAASFTFTISGTGA